MNTNKGTSAVCIHTQKGKKLFDAISSKLKFVEVSLFDVVKSNKSCLISANEHKNRSKFFENIDKKPLKTLVKKYVKVPFVKRVVNKFKKVLLKIANKVK